jgi:hypothetical protein
MKEDILWERINKYSCGKEIRGNERVYSTDVFLFSRCSNKLNSNKQTRLHTRIHRSKKRFGKL